MATVFEDARSIESDKLAVAWYNQAANQGHADAQFRLGRMLENARGVDRDYKLAVEWYRKAAEQGHTNAQWTMGLMYDLGYGVEKNKKIAAEWYQKAGSGTGCCSIL